jgi:hypothetical protein
MESVISVQTVMVQVFNCVHMLLPGFNSFYEFLMPADAVEDKIAKIK